MSTSAYEDVMEAIKAGVLSVKVSTQQGAAARYFARRGPIAWGNFAFEQHPFACSIQDTESDLDDRPGQHEAMLRIEMMTAMPADTVPATDDQVIYTLRQDAKAILHAARAQKTTDGRGIIGVIGDVRCQLAYDANILVQGVIVTFTVRYLQV